MPHLSIKIPKSFSTAFVAPPRTRTSTRTWSQCTSVNTSLPYSQVPCRTPFAPGHRRTMEPLIFFRKDYASNATFLIDLSNRLTSASPYHDPAHRPPRVSGFKNWRRWPPRVGWLEAISTRLSHVSLVRMGKKKKTKKARVKEGLSPLFNCCTMSMLADSAQPC